MTELTQALLRWHHRFGRKDLPWQRDPTPYRVWISEIMLQQTQVATVVPYFLRFMESFPDIETLASTPIDDVLRHWSGLGYYARARNLHRAAQVIRDEHDGAFPTEFDQVIGLPGIGQSTAGAILSLAYGQRHAILDGNAKRVLARFHAVDGWPGKADISKKLWALANQHTPYQDVAKYTQAIMDLGATVCLRTKPVCGVCPLNGTCSACKLGVVGDYPTRRTPKDKPLHRTHMLLAYADGAVYLERRPAKGIWGGLWSLPELSSENDVNQWCERELNARPEALDHWDTMRHSFTHYDLDIQPIAVRLSKQSSKVHDTEDSVWYKIGSSPPGGIAAPVSKLIQTLSTL